MKKLTLIVIFTLTAFLTDAQTLTFEGGHLSSKFDSLKKSVSRVNYHYLVYRNEVQPGTYLQKNMTAEQGVNLASVLIQGPKEWQLSKNMVNRIPIETGSITIAFLNGNWEIGYQALKKSENYVIILNKEIIFTMRQKTY